MQTQMQFYSKLNDARNFSQVFYQTTMQSIKIEDLYYIREPLAKPVVELTEDEMSMSPYGDLKEKETKYDDTVRKSKEIDCNYLFKKTENAFLKISSLLDSLKESIEKFTCTEVKIVPYKLIRYEKDSFFKTHVDSLKATNNIGTILLCLSSDYEGGSFVIYHKDKKYEFDLETSDVLFFYGSCPHEVKPLVSGTRYVITFDVYSIKNLNTITNLLNTEITEKYEDFFKELVSNVSDKKYINICIELEHKYASGFPNDETMYENETYCPSSLKGSDKVMYEFLLSKINKDQLDKYFVNKDLRFAENVLRIRNLTDREQSDARLHVPSRKNLSPMITGYNMYKTHKCKYNDKYTDVCNDCYNKEQLDKDNCYCWNVNEEQAYCGDSDLIITDYSKWNRVHKIDTERLKWLYDETCSVSDNDFDPEKEESDKAFYIGNQHCLEYYDYGKVFLVIKKGHLLQMFSS
jgi:predicted 2-oxoglutarate/Fe(II)-dependent dioxygenase YbiX